MKLFHLNMHDAVKHGVLRAVVVLFVLACAFSVLMHSGMSHQKQIIAAVPFLIAFGLASWFYVMDTEDRSIVSFGKLR